MSPAPLVKPCLIVAGVRGNRPDGEVTALLVGRDGTSVELTLRWQEAVDIATTLLGAAMRAAEVGAVPTDVFGERLNAAFARAAGRAS